jgi:cell division protein FtsB
MTKAARPVNSPSFLAVLIAGTVTVFFLIAIVREFIQSQNFHRQLGRLRADVATEEQRQHELHDLLAYLSSPTFQERQARLELGLKAEGERVIVVPDSVGGDQVTNSQTATDGSTLSNPGKWWRYFFAAKKPVQ